MRVLNLLCANGGVKLDRTRDRTYHQLVGSELDE